MQGEPLFTAATKRLHHKRKMIANAPPPLPPLMIASVEGASFDGVEGHLVVTIAVSEGATLNDPEAADPAKWTATYDGFAYVGAAIFYSSEVSFYVGFTRSGDGGGENVLSYAADPSDISDTTGAMLAAVSNYPI